MQALAAEIVEKRLDKAEANILEALDSEDSRRRDAASFFVVRNTASSKRRGWIPAAGAAIDINITASAPTTVTYRWRMREDDLLLDLRAKLEEAVGEDERLELERRCAEVEKTIKAKLTAQGPFLEEGSNGEEALTGPLARG